MTHKVAMTMLVSTVVAVSAIFLVLPFTIDSEPIPIVKHHTTLPPGYVMSCSNGLYVPIIEKYDIELKCVNSARDIGPCKSLQDAIDRAWEQYEFMPEIRPHYNFPRCD